MSIPSIERPVRLVLASLVLAQWLLPSTAAAQYGTERPPEPVPAWGWADVPAPPYATLDRCFADPLCRSWVAPVIVEHLRTRARGLRRAGGIFLVLGGITLAVGIPMSYGCTSDELLGCLDAAVIPYLVATPFVLTSVVLLGTSARPARRARRIEAVFSPAVFGKGGAVSLLGRF